MSVWRTPKLHQPLRQLAQWRPATSSTKRGLDEAEIRNIFARASAPSVPAKAKPWIMSLKNIPFVFDFVFEKNSFLIINGMFRLCWGIVLCSHFGSSCQACPGAPAHCRSMPMLPKKGRWACRVGRLDWLKNHRNGLRFQIEMAEKELAEAEQRFRVVASAFEHDPSPIRSALLAEARMMVNERQRNLDWQEELSCDL